MENNNQTAGKTAKIDSLTENQKERLIIKMNDLSNAKKIFENTTSHEGKNPVRVISFHNGISTTAAVTSDPKMTYFVEKNGNDVSALYDPEFFEYVENYFIRKMNSLLEEIYSIYQEGGEI